MYAIAIAGALLGQPAPTQPDPNTPWTSPEEARQHLAAAREADWAELRKSRIVEKKQRKSLGIPDPKKCQLTVRLRQDGGESATDNSRGHWKLHRLRPGRSEYHSQTGGDSITHEFTPGEIVIGWAAPDGRHALLAPQKVEAGPAEIDLAVRGVPGRLEVIDSETGDVLDARFIATPEVVHGVSSAEDTTARPGYGGHIHLGSREFDGTKLPFVVPGAIYEFSVGAPGHRPLLGHRAKFNEDGVARVELSADEPVEWTIRDETGRPTPHPRVWTRHCTKLGLHSNVPFFVADRPTFIGDNKGRVGLHPVDHATEFGGSRADVRQEIWVEDEIGRFCNLDLGSKSLNDAPTEVTLRSGPTLRFSCSVPADGEPPLFLDPERPEVMLQFDIAERATLIGGAERARWVGGRRFQTSVFRISKLTKENGRWVGEALNCPSGEIQFRFPENNVRRLRVHEWPTDVVAVENAEINGEPLVIGSEPAPDAAEEKAVRLTFQVAGRDVHPIAKLIPVWFQFKVSADSDAIETVRAELRFDAASGSYRCRVSQPPCDRECSVTLQTSRPAGWDSPDQPGKLTTQQVESGDSELAYVVEIEPAVTVIGRVRNAAAIGPDIKGRVLFQRPGALSEGTLDTIPDGDDLLFKLTTTSLGATVVVRSKTARGLLVAPVPGELLAALAKGHDEAWVLDWEEPEETVIRAIDSSGRPVPFRSAIVSSSRGLHQLIGVPSRKKPMDELRLRIVPEGMPLRIDVFFPEPFQSTRAQTQAGEETTVVVRRRNEA